MLAVTSHQGPKDRLRQIAGALRIAPPVFYARVADLPAASEDGIVLLDLASCCREPQLAVTVAGWVARHPRCALILYVPLIERDCEMHAMFDLASLGAAQVMTASDFARLEVWQNVLERHVRAALQEEIRADFLEAVARVGRRLPAENIVVQLLVDGPATTDPHAVAARAISCPATHADARRRAVWKRLRHAGQMSAPRLLLVSRVLWYAMLRDRGWRAGRIAAFLGFRTTRLLRLTVRRRLGVSMEQMHSISYRDVLAWAADLCTREPAGMSLPPGLTTPSWSSTVRRVTNRTH